MYCSDKNHAIAHVCRLLELVFPFKWFMFTWQRIPENAKKMHCKQMDQSDSLWRCAMLQCLVTLLGSCMFRYWHRGQSRGLGSTIDKVQKHSSAFRGLVNSILCRLICLFTTINTPVLFVFSSYSPWTVLFDAMGRTTCIPVFSMAISKDITGNFQLPFPKISWLVWSIKQNHMCSWCIIS